MSVPTQAEVYARMRENMVKVQEDAYLLSHLTRSMSNSRKDAALADGWFSVGELFKRMLYQVNMLMQGKLQ